MTSTGHRCLGELLRDVARRRPGAVALADGPVRVSYGQLDADSDRIAAAILRRDPGPFVGVLADRSIASITAMIGVLKAGRAYVPLDPAYPADRLRYMAEDAGLRCLIGAEDLTGDLELGLDPLPVTEVADLAVPGIEVAPDDPAYVIYTSGSTGRPKGCVVTHGNVLSLLSAALPLFDVGPDDRWTLFHSGSFDFSVWELWGALATGGTAVVVPGAAARSPESFAELLERERVTVLNQVPSVFRYTVSAGLPDSLRQLIFGGESVELDVVRDFLAAARNPVNVVNMYGITETTVHVTYKRITEADLRGAVRSPIGRPLPHLDVAVLDEDRRPVPEGEVGEMWVSGAGVAAGYLDRPELTAARFASIGGRRSYRTGDLARVLPNGELEYLGRADRQVKLRGFRIELGEVEAVLRQSGLVRDAAATVVSTRRGARLLTVCVVPVADTDGDLVRRLRRHVAGLLPSYMTPDRYHVAEALPQTPSGKTDRTALAAMVADEEDVSCLK